MNKTYLIAKIGKSVKFDPKSWSGFGGDCDAPLFFTNIAELNPNDKFIVIGRNDLYKYKMVPSNIIDIYDGTKSKDKKNINFVLEKLKDIKIDGCFLMSGPSSPNTNIPFKSFTKRSLDAGAAEYSKVLETFLNYVAPIYIFLNETKIPWIQIANDPRYIVNGNDMTNIPVKVLSQFNEEVTAKRTINFTTMERESYTLDCVYAEMEKTYLINKKIERKEKTNKFMVVLNEGNNGVKSRYPLLKEYVLDHIKDAEVYGKWSDEYMEDTRFKGTIGYHELQEMLPSLKYTFIIPIKSGWATMKVWEMISNSVIPFFHPTYDSQRNLNVPEYIRINSPEELHEKIEELENNKELYDKILYECLLCIKESDIDGTNLNSILMKELDNIDYKTYNSSKINFEEKKEDFDDNEW